MCAGTAVCRRAWDRIAVSAVSITAPEPDRALVALCTEGVLVLALLRDLCRVSGSPRNLPRNGPPHAPHRIGDPFGLELSDLSGCPSLTRVEYINRNVIANHRDHSSLIRVRVPLFCRWLQNRGATELYQLQQSKGRLNSARSKKDEISAHEVYEVSQGLSYRGRDIGTDEVRVWLEQFGVIESQRLMLKLLRKLRDTGLHSLDKFMFALSELHKLARQEANSRKFSLNIDTKNRNRIKNCFVTHADETGKSGSEVVKQYRSQNSVYVDNCGDPSKVISAMAKGDWDSAVLVCVNDFVGTGHSATADLKQNVIDLLDKNIPSWHEKVLLIYAVVVGFEDGLNYIKEHIDQDVRVICARTLTSAEKAFSEENNIFTTADERIRAHDLAIRIGLAIEKRAPLGYEDSQALIIFPDNVPNNSLPILYKEGAKYDGKPWKPLFPRS